MADVVVVLVELKCLQCSLVVLVFDSLVDDVAVGKEEVVLIARGWHGQPDDIAVVPRYDSEPTQPSSSIFIILYYSLDSQPSRLHPLL